MNSNQQHNTIYRPYCYLIGWSKLNKYYYGSRTAKERGGKLLYHTGCHPDDFWVTYFTSSPIVAEYRALYGEPDIIQIRKTFNTAEEASRWEGRTLCRILTSALREKFLNRNYSGVTVLTMEQRQKAADAKRGRKHTEEHCRKISEAQRGRKHTEEHRRNNSAARIGKKQSEYHRQRNSEGHKGLKQSEETKRKRSEKLRGRKLPSFTDEHRRNMSESHKGKKQSEETKRKRLETRRRNKLLKEAQ